MSSNEEEIANLAARIRKSPMFAGAPDRRALFDYLFKRRAEYTSGRTLAEDHFKIDHNDFDLDAGRVRAQCNDLRDALEKYEDAPDAIWRCVFPQGIRGQGYRLQFERIQREDAPARLFWRPHLDVPKRVMAVCNSQLFFYDPEREYMFRFGDVNAEGREDEALSELKRLHPEAHKDSLRHNYTYLTAGEVNAFEMLQRWFYDRTKVLIPRYVSRDLLDSQSFSASPVLLGRRGANRFIRRIMDSEEAAHLGYRFQPPLGSLFIDKPTPKEHTALARFPLSPENVLGPVPQWQVIFGVVTRLPNPSGQGTVTIISAELYPKAMTQIMASLTDNNSCGRIIDQMGWPQDGPLPPSFELLFAVRQSPGNLEGEGHAELLCGRSYPA